MAQKREVLKPMLIRDIEIENYPFNRARLYIGKKALKKNVFFPVALPLDNVKQLNLFED